jgi:hypothetical protein
VPSNYAIYFNIKFNNNTLNLYLFLYMWEDTGEMGTIWELGCATIGNILWHLRFCHIYWRFPVSCELCC